MAKRTVTVSMDEQVHAQADEARWTERMSMSAWVERAVREYLAAHPTSPNPALG